MPRSKRALRVACVGHAALDHVFEIDAFPTEPTKTLARASHNYPGGMSLHAAMAARRLGAITRLLTRIGDDASGRLVCEYLALAGVQTEGVHRVAGTQTSRSAVIVDAKGMRQIYGHRGDALERAPALDTRELDGADVVMADPRWPDGAMAALRWARARGVPSLLDADVAPPGVLDRLLPLTRWVAFSEPGLALWASGQSQAQALRRARTQGCEIAMVTLGAAGVCWLQHGTDVLQRARPPRVRARDTTGAGDVFHAAFALALVEGRDVADAAAWACAAAAFKCERGMGVYGAPTRRQLNAWLARRRPRNAAGG